MAHTRIPGSLLREREEQTGALGLKIGLLVFVLLVVIAIVLDLSNLGKRPPRAVVDVQTEIQNLILGLDGPRHVDPSGRFSIVIPAGWRVLLPPDSKPYDVVFSGPHSVDISILASPVPYNDLPSLAKDIDKAERGFNLRVQKEPMFFQEKPAVRRICRLQQTQLLAIDFVSGNVAHHLMCSVPPEYFSSFRPVLEELLNTYRFGAAVTNAAKEISP
ncbi:MAG: hypothetical protein BWK77_08845 [Verrucomicrobia bacterium A1]|nr:MAG: hypothetical protein BWK77_08845 [Verrucomicrobia bacterium A1]